MSIKNNILPERSFREYRELFDNLKIGQIYKVIARKVKRWNETWKPSGFFNLKTYQYQEIEPGTIALCLDNSLVQLSSSPHSFLPLSDAESSWKQEDFNFWNRIYPKFLVGDQIMWIHVSWLEKI